MSDELSAGAVLVSALVGKYGASVVARKVTGMTEAAVRLHASGASTPRPAARARYMSAYDVPIDAWDAGGPRKPATRPPPVGPAPLPANVGGPIPAVGGTDALTVVRDLLQAAREELAASRADPLADRRERAQLLTSATGLARLLARLSGSLEISERMLVRSPHFERVVALFNEVLSKYPEACKELEAEIEAFASGGDS